MEARILATRTAPTGRFTEYRTEVLLGSERAVAWRRYSAFVEFAAQAGVEERLAARCPKAAKGGGSRRPAVVAGRRAGLAAFLAELPEEARFLPLGARFVFEISEGGFVGSFSGFAR